MEEGLPKGRVFRRRRRANVEGGRLYKHEVKVSPEEEAALLVRANAQGVTIPRLLVESALAERAGETATERREQLAELFRLHRMLAALGNNLNQIARAANADGTIPVDLRAELVHTMTAVRASAERVDGFIEAASERA